MSESNLVLNTEEVLRLINMKRTALYVTLIPKLNFPKPIKLGLRKNGWFRVDVEAWIAQRAGHRAFA